MKKIGLLSDTHGYLDPTIFKHFDQCDEIWHAGDIGPGDIIKQLSDFRTTRAVFGNIDDRIMSRRLPEDLRFSIEDLDVFITHIGGYPGRYNSRIRKIMEQDPPGLFICGHSHILKVMYDQKYHCLHMNPGACGHHGFHKIRTVLRFEVEAGRVQNAAVIELGQRGQLSGYSRK